MNDIEKIAMLCHEANQKLAQICVSTSTLPCGRGTILTQANKASNALAAILRQCDQIELATAEQAERLLNV